jgi:uncharacterized protein YndB with AHSA1/START domain
MSEYGKMVAEDALRLERLLPGPIERVWAYLTESEKRAKWLAGGPMELRVGGLVKLTFKHSELSGEKLAPEKHRQYEGHTSECRITACDPPRLLSFTWGEPKDGVVTFELTPRGKDVLLVITHSRVAERGSARNFAGGWHAHVDILEDVLNSRAPRGFWSNHAKLEAEYQKRIPGE